MCTFQSTLPRRERLKLTHIKDVSQLFQSTLPRRERQVQNYTAVTITGISIHAPAKGATGGKDPPSLCRRISIHAPAKGATLWQQESAQQSRFQSTLPRRERQHLLTSFRLQYGYFYFISTIKYSSCFKKIN